ncbi:hypothetical protein PHAMO_200033 [Magnetospirillum molischianum DSM 120]|uniref:Uncharacterized protein n=1 Tax=Magnetospirillum molischianum DSM 120 TaxID=1150626 RepID=H8FQ10_MAGML|nr:hypothetical protein PHAMO_200033 [Magnetospirillum molischianum DSM 120]
MIGIKILARMDMCLGEFMTDIYPSWVGLTDSRLIMSIRLDIYNRVYSRAISTSSS